MSQCINKQTGRSKIPYGTRSQARRELKRLQGSTLHLVATYKCHHCKMWHNGRQPQTSEYYHQKMQAKALNERLTGKLIAALRLVLDKQN